MQYVKINDGEVEAYPYSISNLRANNQNTSFPSNISENLLAEYGVYPVDVSEKPYYDEKIQRIRQKSIPELIDGKWTIVWTVDSLSDNEIEELKNALSEIARGDRNNLLSASDWTQVDDAPVSKSVWAAYRQALRDITNQDDFPYNIVWPTKPE